MVARRTYKEAKAELRDVRKARGFFDPTRRGPDKTKSRCANCGESGHWKAECTGP